ncbi:MAG TPA: ABC transporter ATP-binding protein [Vicinamibacteria bacterium]|nr:ABC transporter ATP-binding protein [Vicinamibacteria bacterium]
MATAAIEHVPEERKAQAPAIHLQQVEKVYRTDRIETVALQNLNLAVGEGELLAIMGPSGCGKSTLLHLMGLLDVPSRGRLLLGGRDMTTAGDRERSRYRNAAIGFVFQSFHLIPELSVLDNVEIPLLYRRTTAGERRRLAQAALERVGLGSRLHHYPGQLSGGQQQRVAVARAIVGQPRLLLADEPTGNLDSQMGDEIMALLEGLNQDGATVVMVTHDPRLSQRAHRTVRLFDGRQVQ